MYKINEAADALGVTRVEVFEILLSQRERFSPYVQKQNSITYITDQGLNVLRSALGLNVDEEQPIPTLTEELSTQGEILEDVLLTELHEQDMTSDLSETVITEVELNYDQLESEDLVGLWMNEIKKESTEASDLDTQLRVVRTQITQLRNKILSLDSEIKRKDDAIRHYHEIMTDDLHWINDLEEKLLNQIKSSENNEVREVSATEEKGAFFKLFKR